MALFIRISSFTYEMISRGRLQIIQKKAMTEISLFINLDPVSGFRIRQIHLNAITQPHTAGRTRASPFKLIHRHSDCWSFCALFHSPRNQLPCIVTNRSSSQAHPNNCTVIGYFPGVGSHSLMRISICKCSINIEMGNSYSSGEPQCSLSHKFTPVD